MSSRRQRSILLGGRSRQVSLYEDNCRHCSGCSRWSNSIYAPRYDLIFMMTQPWPQCYVNHITQIDMTSRYSHQTNYANKCQEIGQFLCYCSFVFSQPATKLHDWCTCIFGSPERPTMSWRTPQLQHWQSRLLHLHRAQHHSGKIGLPSHTQDILLETGSKRRFGHHIQWNPYKWSPMKRYRLELFYNDPISLRVAINTRAPVYWHGSILIPTG